MMPARALLLALITALPAQATVTRHPDDTCGTIPPICDGQHPLIFPLNKPVAGSLFRFYIASQCGSNIFPGLPHVLGVSSSNATFAGTPLPASLATLGAGRPMCFWYVGDGAALAARKDKVWRFFLSAEMVGLEVFFQGAMLVPHDLSDSRTDFEILTTDLLTIKVQAQ